MPKVTYDDLFLQVVELIKQTVSYPQVDDWEKQTSTTQVTAPVVVNTRNLSVEGAEVYTNLAELLGEIMPSYIRSGLSVEATDPESDYVTVKAGEGVATGKVYRLHQDVQIKIPLDKSESIWYINLYENGLRVEKTTAGNVLSIAKIIVPNPTVTSRIRDKSDGSWDAYIVSLKEARLYVDSNGHLEDESIELLRDSIGEILADNLIGNIKLSENLKVINTTGSLVLDSESLKVLDSSENVLSKFNRHGVFLYDSNGIEMAKFTGSEARIGNILITKNSLESENFVSGSSGFQILDSGDAEFNDITVRGTIYGSAGEIGGWTIASNMLYANPTGIIQTGQNVGTGQNGVKISADGIEVFDDVLGRVVYLPSDGSTPQISSGTIQEVTFEISTNAVLRTSSTVGDGSAQSAGILINNTGIYGCEENQTLVNANLKALIDGTVKLRGEIEASSGEIGGVTITEDKLSGGAIEGSLIRAPVIESSASVPKIRLDEKGLYFLVSSDTGKYGSSGSGGSGFKYGDGTKYGAGVIAYLFNGDLPPLTISSEQDVADIRLFNRSADPSSGSHRVGDLIVVGGELKICTVAGSPGTFSSVGGASALVDLTDTNMTDPDTDALVFWDDSASTHTYLLLDSSLSISTLSGGDQELAVDWTYVDNKFDTSIGHDHDGSDSKKVLATNLDVTGISDGDVLVNSSGSVSGKTLSNVSFLVFLEQNTDTSNPVKVKWTETNGFDSNGDFDDTNDKFVCSIAGKYFFSVKIRFKRGTSGTGSAVNIYFYKNGSSYMTKDFYLGNSMSSGDTADIEFSVLMDLSVNDYIEIYATNDNNNYLVVDGTSNQNSQFQGFLLTKLT